MKRLYKTRKAVQGVYGTTQSLYEVVNTDTGKAVTKPLRRNHARHVANTRNDFYVGGKP